MVTCETESKWCNNILEDRGATYRWPMLIKVRQIETLGAWTWITFVHWSHMFWTSGCWFDVKQGKDKTRLDKKTRFKLPSLSITASRIHLEKYLTWCVLEQKHLNPPGFPVPTVQHTPATVIVPVAPRCSKIARRTQQKPSFGEKG